MKSSASKRVADFERHVTDPTARQRNHEQVVNEYYELVNETCQSFWGPTHHFSVYAGQETPAEAAEHTERILVDRGGFGPGMRLLDIGCGVGGPAFTVARHSGAHVTGLDMVPSRVETARSGAAERGLAPITSFEVGDAMKLPYPRGHFDGAYTIEALCHVPDKRQAHREAARVLRPGAPWLGYDWILRDSASAADIERYAEPICPTPRALAPQHPGADQGGPGGVGLHRRGALRGNRTRQPGRELDPAGPVHPRRAPRAAPRPAQPPCTWCRGARRRGARTGLRHHVLAGQSTPVSGSQVPLTHSFGPCSPEGLALTDHGSLHHNSRRAAPRFDDILGGGRRKPPDRVADQAERRHRADQGGHAPAGHCQVE